MSVSEEYNEFYGADQRCRVFAVAGGKGGVGKTVISASLGVGLAMMKKRVIIIDADLAGANLNTAVGIEKPSRTSYEFLKGDIQNLNDLLLDHPRFPNLQILSGTTGPLGMANLSCFQRLKFIQNIKNLNADFIIIDLGAGTDYNVLDFFVAADRGIVVANPDSLSVLDSYNFIKLALLKKISREIKGQFGGLNLMKQIAYTETHRTQMTMHELVRQIRMRDVDLGEKIVRLLSEFRPLLLINMLMETKDENMVLAIRAAAQELLAIHVAYLGSIRKDTTVEKSLHEMTPFITYDPQSPASRDLANIIITKFIHSEWFATYRDAKAFQNRLLRLREIKKDAFICSVKCCLYWHECSFKKGGYPCSLMSSIPRNKKSTG
jgi:flagellar biosynthesis protein FlhG